VTALLLALVGLAAGVLGALMGVGGGVIVVPALSAIVGLPFRHAVAVSLVVIIASSSASAAAYVGKRVADVKVGVVLELATVAGAVAGSTLAVIVPVGALKLAFSALAIYSAGMLWVRRNHATEEASAGAYEVRRWPLGLGASAVAGAVSGLLGVGGGLFKVPAMTLGMGLPFKVAAATSNFMIGVTAAASAYVYYARGELDVDVAAPVVVGVFLGARLGSSLLVHLPARRLQSAFAALLLFLGGRMAWEVLGAIR
jgi:uncharacterized membrane protein YfcA